MVTKKKVTPKKSTVSKTAVEPAAEQGDDIERQARLRALRAKRKGRRTAAADGEGDAPGWQLSGDGEGNERKRELVKKLIKKRKKRMAKGRGKRMGPGRANAGAAGKGISKFPRLKTLLEQRGEKGGKAAVDIVELEDRVTRIETALETILQKLEDAGVFKS